MPDSHVRQTTAVLTDATGAHLEAYFQGLTVTEEVTDVVVVDPSGTQRDLAQRTLGDKLVEFTGDLRGALRKHQPALSLVSMEGISSPPAIAAALEANCHVLAEKPACVRVEDFAPLARLADMKHRHLMLALANRLRGTMQLARQMIRQGKLGRVYGCELHLVADQTRLKNPAYHQTWYAQQARGGGGHLIWLGIHWLDLAMHLTGSPIISVAGFVANVGGQPLDVEDSAAMALQFENGSLGTMTSGYYLDRGYHSHIKIWGSDGWLQLEPHGGEALQWYSTRESSPAVHTYDGPADEASYTPLVRAAVRASLDLEEPPLTSADSLRALEVVFACYRAAETGQRQAVAIP
jgi:UDP-N-acetyl-2-amino-2-deoxyglucuronate dehydrogenase